MNNSKILKKVEQKLYFQGDQSQIQSKEVEEEDYEVREVLKENQYPKHETQYAENQEDVVLPVQANLILPEDTPKKNEEKMSRTASPFKGQKRVKSGKPIELEFTWKKITVKAQPIVGSCTKLDPEIHKAKVLN